MSPLVNRMLFPEAWMPDAPTPEDNERDRHRDGPRRIDQSANDVCLDCLFGNPCTDPAAHSAAPSEMRRAA